MLLYKMVVREKEVMLYLTYSFFFFLIQQFITQCMVADHGSYFVTTYRRCKQHVEEETEEEKRKNEEKKRTNHKDYEKRKEEREIKEQW